jgi:hypothetical protein
VWDLRSGQCIHELAGHRAWISALCSDEEKWLVSVCREGTLKLWGLSNGVEHISIETGTGIAKSKEVQVSVSFPWMMAMVAAAATAAVYDLSTGTRKCSLTTSANLIDFNWPLDDLSGRALFLSPLRLDNHQSVGHGVLQLWNVDNGSSMDHEFGEDCTWVSSVDWSSDRVVVAIAKPTRYWWSCGSFRKLQFVGLQLWSLSTQNMLYSLSNGLRDAPQSLHVDWDYAEPRAVTCHEDILLGHPTKFMAWDFETGTVNSVKAGSQTSLYGIVACVVRP